MKKAIRGSLALQECQERLKGKKKENLSLKERRVLKVTLDLRECQGMERKVNLENQDPEESLEKMVKKEKRGLQGFPAPQGSQDNQDNQALRETKVKQVLQAHLEL